MNKSDLTSKIFKNLSFLKKQDVDEASTILIEKISSSLQEKDRVEIRGFGTFSTRKRASRIGRNPKTGSAISVHSKFYPYFRSAKALKLELN